MPIILSTPQGTVERSLLSLIDWDEMATDLNLRTTWASCMAQLPALGGSGSQGVQHRSNWVEFCLQLVDSVHCTINGMFRNIEELKVNNKISQGLFCSDIRHKLTKPICLHHRRKRLR